MMGKPIIFKDSFGGVVFGGTNKPHHLQAIVAEATLLDRVYMQASLFLKSSFANEYDRACAISRLVMATEDVERFRTEFCGAGLFANGDPVPAPVAADKAVDEGAVMDQRTQAGGPPWGRSLAEVGANAQ